jgi:hypothetical protein
MPNHVINKVTCTNPKVLSALVVDDKVDFNTILPMPKELNVTAGNVEYFAQEIIQQMKLKNKTAEECLKEHLPELLDGKGEQVQIYLNNYTKYGATSWYDWCIANWGTKWNAYEFIVRSNELEFQTAWRTPVPVLIKLSKRFPEETITLNFADEDIGNNCGTMTVTQGDIETDYMPEGTEAKQFACELWGYEGEDDDI